VTKKKKRLGLAVPIGHYEALRAESSRQGKTINSLCLDIFWAWMIHLEQQKQMSISSGTTRQTV
jgi:hypothetical protein